MTLMTERHEPSTAKRVPLRACAGCGKRAPAEELVRVVLDPAVGEVAVDLAGSGFGRGAHFHGAPDCLAKALKGGLSRVFKQKVVGDASAIAADIVNAADRRIEGLLLGARRAGQLALGSDAVVEACREGWASLVIVARDAAAASKLSEVQKAVAEGKAIAWSEKRHLGLITGRSVSAEGGGAPDPVAVVAVLHPGVAAAVARTYRLSAPFRVNAALRSEEAWSSSPEVR
jgi:predicted RNA-binding protein YlxR (DUF448 family)/ribosomal protein L30E